MHNLSTNAYFLSIKEKEEEKGAGCPPCKMDGAPYPDVKFWVHLICLSKYRIEIFCVLLLGKKFHGRQNIKGDVVLGFLGKGNLS